MKLALFALMAFIYVGTVSAATTPTPATPVPVASAPAAPAPTVTTPAPVTTPVPVVPAPAVVPATTETPVAVTVATTPPPAVPATIEEAVTEGGMLLKAIESKNWPLVVGILLTLVVFAANKFGLKNLVGSKLVPWVAMGLALLGTVGVGLAAGIPFLDALFQGILAGVMAIGGWELLLKNITGKVEATPAPTT